jgi:hypothetical protein
LDELAAEETKIMEQSVEVAKKIDTSKAVLSYS